MVTAIALGTFFNFNGRNVLGGIGGSGLDTQSLLNALTQAKAAPALALQQKITKNDAITSALTQFKQLAASFQSVANNLRNPPGVGNSADNAFTYNSVSVTSNTAVSGGTYFSVTAAPGVTPQDFVIDNIISRAAAGKQTSETLTVADADTTGLVVASGATDGHFNAGTITIRGIGDEDDADITFETGDTLHTLVAKFNNVSDQTGIVAGIIQVAGGQFALSFTSSQTGADYAFDLDDVGTVIDDPSNVLVQIDFADTQAASNAEFDLDGVTIIRSTNAISDAVNGVTFNLLQVPDNPTIVTVSLTTDTSTAFNSIVALADSYNALKLFEAKQLATNDDGTFADSAVLATNQLFRSTMNTITTEVLSIVNGLSGSAPNDLTDIGITFAVSAATSSDPEVSNVLTIDETVLRSFLDANFTQVRNLFEFTLTTDNPNLQVFSRTNALSINNFTLDVNPFASQVTQALDVADTDTAVAAFDSPTNGQLGTGTITINGEDIVIDNDDTLDVIAQKFNDVTATTGLAAAVTGSAGAFVLTFTATRQSGQPNLFDLSSSIQDPDGVFANVVITATGTYQATYDPGTGDIVIDLDGEAITGGGGFLLTGQDGTVLEGLELIYGSQAASQSDVTVTQGVADRLYNIAESLLDESGGSLAAEIDSIEELDDRLQDQIERINDRVTQFRDLLLGKFAALEQAISQVNRLLQALDADAQARQAAAG